jgi:hypothetical protein|tara:strand:- start:352 stop:636 length:285 start_codon:yes stop_codon:yes gene_type:complete
MNSKDKVKSLLEKDLNDCQEQLLIMLSAAFRQGPIKGFKTLDVVLFCSALMGDKMGISIEVLKDTIEGYNEAIKHYKFEQEFAETVIFKNQGEA